MGACEEIETSSMAVGEVVLINIFPNPSSGPVNITIQALISTDASVEIFNFSGQKMTALLYGSVQDGEHYFSAVNAGNWPEGSYFVAIKLDGTTHARQFVIKK